MTKNASKCQSLVSLNFILHGELDTIDIKGPTDFVIADNVFEQNTPYGGCAIRSASGATQVIIRNNLFVNFGSSAVEISGMASRTC
jgi:hypothetical protein